MHSIPFGPCPRAGGYVMGASPDAKRQALPSQERGLMAGYQTANQRDLGPRPGEIPLMSTVMISKFPQARRPTAANRLCQEIERRTIHRIPSSSARQIETMLLSPPGIPN